MNFQILGTGRGIAFPIFRNGNDILVFPGMKVALGKLLVLCVGHTTWAHDWQKAKDFLSKGRKGPETSSLIIIQTLGAWTHYMCLQSTLKWYFWYLSAIRLFTSYPPKPPSSPPHPLQTTPPPPPWPECFSICSILLLLQICTPVLSPKSSSEWSQFVQWPWSPESTSSFKSHQNNRHHWKHHPVSWPDYILNPPLPIPPPQPSPPPPNFTSRTGGKGEKICDWLCEVNLYSSEFLCQMIIIIFN